MKLPKPFYVCSPSMFVSHDGEENAALQMATPDYGLKPNGLTIEDLRTNVEFYSTSDELDRLGVAQRVSGSLANDVKSAVTNLISKFGNIVKPSKN